MLLEALPDDRRLLREDVRRLRSPDELVALLHECGVLLTFASVRVAGLLEQRDKCWVWPTFASVRVFLVRQHFAS